MAEECLFQNENQRSEQLGRIIIKSLQSPVGDRVGVGYSRCLFIYD